MRERNRYVWKALLPLGLLAMALAIFRRRGDDWEYERADAEPEVTPVRTVADAAAPKRHRSSRFVVAGAFTTLFFAGAAFTAGAGDQAVRLMDEDATALAEYQAATTAEAEPAPAAEAAPAPGAAPAPEAGPAPEAAPASEATPEPAPAAEAAPAEPSPATAAAQAAEPAVDPVATGAPSNLAAPAPAAPQDSTPEQAAAAAKPASKPAAAPPARTAPSTKQWVVKRAAATPPRAPEVELGHEQGYGEPTIWLNRSLPDPTPASARLARRFARQLAAVSKEHGADWAAVLGVLRAQGERGSAPATARQLETLAARLAGHDAWKGALAVSGRTAFADRAAALADVYRFVGLESLVTGFAAAKDRLVQKLLQTEGVLIYAGGRSDIEAGRIDVRIVVLLGYLAERHGSVTVSCLFSGHRRFARPGVVSAHIYGHAVDVAAVGGTPIAGHQQPGGPTEAAVRSVLLLPAELQPQQVISLLGLGGPSFPLADHGDHIHVGY